MKNKLFILLALFAWIFPVVISLHNLTSGSIPFWYDPARDMLSAWANLSKLTLIGPPSGIPGFFYGPYWIWWLSLAELISKDPAVVDFLSMTLPYITLFPLILLLFGKIFGKVTSILLWLLFFYGFQSYFIFIWNPNLAPLLFLTIIYLLSTLDFSNGKKVYGKVFLGGILTGLALNIHISFSVGFSIGSLLFLFVASIVFTKTKQVSNILKTLGVYLGGILLLFVPFFLFEARHGFMQSKTAFNALTHGGDVVAIQGLSKVQIIFNFFDKFGTLLEIQTLLAFIVIGIVLAIFTVLIARKRIRFERQETQLVALLTCITVSVLGVYLLAKNPIWDYHFVGAEIICLLTLGLIIAKVKPLQIILAVLVMYLSIFKIKGFVQSFSVNQLTTQSLFAEENIVRTIQQDAGEKVYTVYAYNPAIYSYDYAYLFKSIANKEFSYDPGQIKRQGIVYLILPRAKQSILEDFIHFHSPPSQYKTTKEWALPNGTRIVKREEVLLQ